MVYVVFTRENTSVYPCCRENARVNYIVDRDETVSYSSNTRPIDLCINNWLLRFFSTLATCNQVTGITGSGHSGVKLTLPFDMSGAFLGMNGHQATCRIESTHFLQYCEDACVSMLVFVLMMQRLWKKLRMNRAGTSILPGSPGINPRESLLLRTSMS